MCEQCEKAKVSWSHGGYDSKCFECRIRHLSTLPRTLRQKGMAELADQKGFMPSEIARRVSNAYKEREALKNKVPGLAL